MSLLHTLFPIARRNACAASNDGDAESIRPAYAIAQNDSGWTLTAQLPGVAKANLSVTDEDGLLRIRGERSWKQPEGWTRLYRESDDAPFELELRHQDEIDIEKIRADFADGLLTLTLPKSESLKPRKIEVN